MVIPEILFDQPNVFVRSYRFIPSCVMCLCDKRHLVRNSKYGKPVCNFDSSLQRPNTRRALKFKINWRIYTYNEWADLPVVCLLNYHFSSFIVRKIFYLIVQMQYIRRRCRSTIARIVQGVRNGILV